MGNNPLGDSPPPRYFLLKLIKSLSICLSIASPSCADFRPSRRARAFHLDFLQDVLVSLVDLEGPRTGWMGWHLNV